MTAYAIFDVEIHNPERYQDFMAQVKPGRLMGTDLFFQIYFLWH
jgi:hypothetical protein